MMLEQPTQSAALKLSMLAGRPEVIRVVVDHCAFGLCDPQSGRPYKRQVVLEVNDAMFAKGLAKNAWCRLLRTMLTRLWKGVVWWRANGCEGQRWLVAGPRLSASMCCRLPRMR